MKWLSVSQGRRRANTKRQRVKAKKSQSELKFFFLLFFIKCLMKSKSICGIEPQMNNLKEKTHFSHTISLSNFLHRKEHRETSESGVRESYHWRESALSAWERARFRPESAVSTMLLVSPDTARVDANQPDSAQIGPSLSHVGASSEKKKKKKKNLAGRGSTRHQHASSSVPRASPYCAASDAGATPLAPCPCFPVFGSSVN